MASQEPAAAAAAKPAAAKEPAAAAAANAPEAAAQPTVRGEDKWEMPHEPDSGFLDPNDRSGEVRNMIKDAGDNLSDIEMELCDTRLGTNCDETQLYGDAHPQLEQRIYDRKNGRAKERESRIVEVMGDSASQAMVEAVSMEQSMHVQVSSESDEDDQAVLRGAAERVVNDEDDQIERHCAALLIRKHDMGLIHKVLADAGSRAENLKI